MHRKWILAIVLALGLLAVTAAVALSWSAVDLTTASGLTPDDDFLISRAEGSLRGSPAVAYNDNLDEYLVVWVDNRGGTDSNIYGQIITGGGIPKGDNFIIRDEASNALFCPDVAYDSVNQCYLVVWYDLTAFDVEGKLLNEDGSAYGSGFTIASGTSANFRGFPSVAAYSHATQGTFAVAYQGGSGGDTNIYARLVSATGTVGSELTISDASGDQTDPDIAVNPANGYFLIVWEDGRAANDRIYGCLLYSTGFLGTEFTVATPSEPVRNPAVAFNPDAGDTGEWLVVFQRDVSGDSQIRGKRVAADGTPTGSSIYICDDGEDQLYPDVAYSAYGSQWLVVWEDHRAGTTNYDIYSRRVDASGNTLGDTFAISTAPDHQTAPAVASSSAFTGYLVVFPDNRTEDISGQRALSSGYLMGSTFAISAPLGQQKQPVVAYNSQDPEFLVVWHDERASNWDIYGQRVDLDGALLGDTFAICSNASGQLFPDVTYNLDTNQYLVVWEDRRADADIYGQRVNAGGSLDGAEIQIAGGGTTARRRPQVAFNPISGEYLVVYVYEEENNNIRGRRVPAAGNPTEVESNIATGTTDQNYPDVACRSMEPGGGGYLVVWRETDGDQRDIKGQRLNQSGDLLGGVRDICTQTDAQWSPRVAYSPDDDRYLVVWPDDRDSSTQGRNVYGRQMAGGGALHDELAISTAGDDQASVAVTYGSGLDGYVVVWKDTRNASTTPDLYGQQVSGTGALVDNNDLLYTGLGAQESPAVAWGGDETTGLVAWQDGRNGQSFHIYGLVLTGSASPTDHSIFLPLVLKSY